MDVRKFKERIRVPKQKLKQKIKIDPNLLERLKKIEGDMDKCLSKYLTENTITASSIIKYICKNIKLKGTYCIKSPLSIKSMYNSTLKTIVIIISLPYSVEPKNIFVVSQSRVYIEEIKNVDKSGYTAYFEIRGGIDNKYGTIYYEKKPENDEKKPEKDKNRPEKELNDLEKGLLGLTMIQHKKAYPETDTSVVYPKEWELYSIHYGQMESFNYEPGKFFEFNIYQLPGEDVVIKLHIDLNSNKENDREKPENDEKKPENVKKGRIIIEKDGNEIFGQPEKDFFAPLLKTVENLHSERVDRLIAIIKYAVNNGVILDDSSKIVFERICIEKEIIPKIKMADENDYGNARINEIFDPDLLQEALSIYNERFNKSLTWVYNIRDSKDGNQIKIRVVKNKTQLIHLKVADLASLGDLKRHLKDLNRLKIEGLTNKSLDAAIQNTENMINGYKLESLHVR